MIRHYELAIVLHPDLEIDMEAASKKVEDIITSAGGILVKKDNWGKRKLAYRINGQDWGIYIFYTVELEPDKLSTIENSLKITDEVMRHLIVSLEHLRKVTKDKKETTKKPSKKKTDEEQISSEVSN